MTTEGMIHEQLDLKILILFVLKRLPAPAFSDEIYDICICDNGVGYFDFAECLQDLVSTSHVKETEDGYRITEKGIRNAEAVENSLPYSVRRSAEQALAPVAEALSRFSMITADIQNVSGEVKLHLGLSDGVGSLMDMTVLCADENQAKKLRRNFRLHAENMYRDIMNLLEDDK